MTGAEWFLGAAILISFCIIAGWQLGGRRRQRFVPPPPSWWVCATCHSVNNADEDLPLTCYRCGRIADPSTVERLETSPEFEWTQQLATTRKGGWERPVGWAADRTENVDAAETEDTEAETGTASDVPDAMPADPSPRRVDPPT